MPRYYHNSSYHHQTRFIRKARKMVVGILVIVVIVGLFVFIDSSRETEQASMPSQPTQEISANYSQPVEIFRSQYFQFQTNKNWKQISNETTGSKFVYRSFDGTLVEHELMIFINDKSIPIETTHILPVELGPNYKLVAGKVSDHCRTAFKTQNPKSSNSIRLSEVQFACNPESLSYTVSVGLKDGSAPMNLIRPDGSKSVYGLIYTDFTASPDDHEIQEIITAFQIR